MSEELKPCPFCGGSSYVETCHSQISGLQNCHYASCLDGDCVAFITVPYSTWATQRQAIAAWNTRAYAAELATLRAQNAVMVSLVIQYRDDLRRPPSGDSLERRLDRIKAVLSQTEGVS